MNIVKPLIGPEIVLGYFNFINKSLVWFLAIFLPFHIPSNIELLDPRGAAASKIKKEKQRGIQ